MLEIERNSFDDETKRKAEGIGSEETRRRCSQSERKEKKTIQEAERIRGKGKGERRGGNEWERYWYCESQMD